MRGSCEKSWKAQGHQMLHCAVARFRVVFGLCKNPLLDVQKPGLRDRVPKCISNIIFPFPTIYPVPPHHISPDASHTSHTCSASHSHHFRHSTSLPRAKAYSAHDCTHQAPVINLFLAFVLKQPPTPIPPLDILTTPHPPNCRWHHECRRD